MKLTAASVLLAGSVLLSNFSLAQEVRNYLANNTVLIIHHSGKPDTGTGLNAAGEARARLYTNTFSHFRKKASRARSTVSTPELKVEFHGDEIFDWVIVLKMGPDGQLTSAKRIHQSLRVPVSIPKRGYSRKLERSSL
jgi:hypothetical protein